MTRPNSGGGITSGPPETHSNTTVSPDAMVRMGEKAASKMPNLTVSGAEAILWCATLFFLVKGPGGSQSNYMKHLLNYRGAVD